MDYTVETSPFIGSGSGIKVHNGTYFMAVHDLQNLTTYRWFVNVTDGVHGTRKIFSFETWYPTKGIILVYATEDGSSYIYDRTFFNTNLPMILENYGFTVTVTDRIMTPTITDTHLTNCNELWILLTKRYTSGVFSANEINTILAFRNTGNGLLIMGDHEDYAGDANQISTPLGVTFYGSANHGSEGSLMYPQFQSHPLFTGVAGIVTNPDEGKMTVNNPAQVVATYQGDNVIALLNDGKGNVVFDVTFTRLFDDGYHGYSWILTGDTPQYVRNIADWLNPIKIGDITGGLFKVKAQIKNGCRQARGISHEKDRRCCEDCP